MVDNNTDVYALELKSVADRYLVVAGSIGTARLAGIQASTGVAVLFLDSDQVLVNEGLRMPLRFLASADAAVLTERAATRSPISKLLDAERALTEAFGLGIPRLFRRETLARAIYQRDVLSKMVFGEDSFLSVCANDVAPPTPRTVLLHDDPPSLRALALKYVRYGKLAASQTNSVEFRRRRSARQTNISQIGRLSPWILPVGCLKLIKATAFTYGRVTATWKNALVPGQPMNEERFGS